MSSVAGDHTLACHSNQFLCHVLGRRGLNHVDGLGQLLNKNINNFIIIVYSIMEEEVVVISSSSESMEDDGPPHCNLSKKMKVENGVIDSKSDMEVEIVEEEREVVAILDAGAQYGEGKLE